MLFRVYALLKNVNEAASPPLVARSDGTRASLRGAQRRGNL
jgi:hypothetical protein